ncbi:hypothetical protein MGG_05925 [Pyricularia oryzae 70-15]|uniref:Uncharacterized protein n=3 Tax=Pyricularia oryzae TaxID=318829 RepID=G4N425_PYRO7|nr:uncharacterized protein MGG_05925 [Pyricularia oryzae 70-15]EHA51947.1 hypothetical protein MGG_05925 [Pyricularia oryzae 70-15]ELQ40915.1 hypothetical protein OOU_Y34scaffold00325g45 [Pyricularia oryzae Y34]KAI7927580.1 hypothetical protein M0657_003158 [Pyricularia oryzae]KAI7928230.1 hypothetical protein M9X92_001918 [Pyricularia oryzae]
MQQLSGTWNLSQDLMAPKGYEAICQGEPSDVVNSNGYHTLEDDFLYDGCEWDDCRSGKRTPPPSRFSLDDERGEDDAAAAAAAAPQPPPPVSHLEWDRDYSNAWDYASLADQARKRSSTVSSSGSSSTAGASSSGGGSSNPSPATKAEKTFDREAEPQSSSTSNRRSGGGFWSFFGRARVQEASVESLRGA